MKNLMNIVMNRLFTPGERTQNILIGVSLGLCTLLALVGVIGFFGGWSSGEIADALQVGVYASDESTATARTGVSPKKNEGSAEEGEGRASSTSKKASPSTKEDRDTSSAQATEGANGSSARTSDVSAGNTGDAYKSPAASSNPTSSGSGQASASTEKPAPPPPPPAPTTMTVSIYVDSSRAVEFGYAACLASQTVTLKPGASVYDALVATGVSVGGSSSYVRSIGGLAEFACGAGSGWLYLVNGTSPGYSAGSYVLYGGESITWVYTLNLGGDL